MRSNFEKRVLPLLGLVLLVATIAVTACKTEPDAPVYTVTFESNGNKVGSQSVAEGGKVIRPADPSVNTVPAGFYTGECVIADWYNRYVKWNFDVDTVTTDITLTADWDLESVDLSARTEANIVDKAIGYIKEDLDARETDNIPKKYTLLLNEDVAVIPELSSARRLAGTSATSVNGLTLTIIGLEQERKIQLDTGKDGELFTIGGTYAKPSNADDPILGAELILGNNITLIGRTTSSDAGYTNYRYHMVAVQANGRLTMLEGSKITGHKTDSGTTLGAPVYVQGQLTMKGGVITGNESVPNTALPYADRSIGGVRLAGSESAPASLIMEGGNISGNTCTGGDVFVANYDICTLSGTAEIGKLVLYAYNKTRAQLNVASGWTGNVTTLNLMGNKASNIDDNLVLWTDAYLDEESNNIQPKVLQAAAGYSLTASDIAKFSLGKILSYNHKSTELTPLLEGTDLSTTHEIVSSGEDIGKLVAKVTP